MAKSYSGCRMRAGRSRQNRVNPICVLLRIPNRNRGLVLGPLSTIGPFQNGKLTRYPVLAKITLHP